MERPCGLVALLPCFRPGSEKKTERPLPAPIIELAGREDEEEEDPGPPLVGSAEPWKEELSFFPSSPIRRLGRRCELPVLAASLPLDVCRVLPGWDGASPLWEPMEPTEEEREPRAEAEAPSSSLLPLPLCPRLMLSI